LSTQVRQAIPHAGKDNHEPSPDRREYRERRLTPGGAHGRGRCPRGRHGVLKFAGNIIARMVPLILLGIFMQPPVRLVFAPPEQVGLRVCVPAQSGSPAATSASLPARRGGSPYSAEPSQYLPVRLLQGAEPRVGRQNPQSPVQRHAHGAR
jgi:hypothetical protein